MLGKKITRRLYVDSQQAPNAISGSGRSFPASEARDMEIETDGRADRQTRGKLFLMRHEIEIKSPAILTKRLWRRFNYVREERFCVDILKTSCVRSACFCNELLSDRQRISDAFFPFLILKLSDSAAAEILTTLKHFPFIFQSWELSLESQAVSKTRQA